MAEIIGKFMRYADMPTLSMMMIDLLRMELCATLVAAKATYRFRWD
jgi:hypothetical protein